MGNCLAKAAGGQPDLKLESLDDVPKQLQHNNSIEATKDEKVARGNRYASLQRRSKDDSLSEEVPVDYKPGDSGRTRNTTDEVSTIHDISTRGGKHLDTVRDLQQQVTMLRKAVSLITRLALAPDLNTALRRIRELVSDVLDCERVTLYVIDHESQELRALATDERDWPPAGAPTRTVPSTTDDQSSEPGTGWTSRALSRAESANVALIRVKLGEGIAGTVALQGGTSNVQDAYADKRFNKEIDRKTGFKTRCMLTTPVADSSGCTVAVLQALNKRIRGETRTFTALDESMLCLFSTHVGNTITNCKLNDLMERENMRIAKLHTSLREINDTKNLEDMMASVLAAQRQLLDAENCAIMVPDDMRGCLWAKGAWVHRPKSGAMMGQSSTALPQSESTLDDADEGGELRVQPTQKRLPKDADKAARSNGRTATSGTNLLPLPEAGEDPQGSESILRLPRAPFESLWEGPATAGRSSPSTPKRGSGACGPTERESSAAKASPPLDIMSTSQRRASTGGMPGMLDVASAADSEVEDDLAEINARVTYEVTTTPTPDCGRPFYSTVGDLEPNQGMLSPSFQPVVARMSPAMSLHDGSRHQNQASSLPPSPLGDGATGDVHKAASSRINTRSFRYGANVHAFPVASHGSISARQMACKSERGGNTSSGLLLSRLGSQHTVTSASVGGGTHSAGLLSPLSNDMRGLPSLSVSSMTAPPGRTAAPTRLDALGTASSRLLASAAESAPACMGNWHGKKNRMEAEVRKLFGLPKPAAAMLLQPVLDPRTGRLLALLIAVNKELRARDAQTDLLYVRQFSEADLNTFQIFAYEVADAFQNRALDLAFATAMSTVADPGWRQAMVGTSGRDKTAPEAKHQGYGALSMVGEILSAQLSDFVAPRDRDGLRSTWQHEDLIISFDSNPSINASMQDVPRALSTLANKESLTAEDFFTRSSVLDLHDFNIDLSGIEEQGLIACVIRMVQELGLMTSFPLKHRKLFNFVSALAGHYSDSVPYHNFQHVVYVTHCVFWVLQLQPIRAAIREEDVLALMVAALCHDLDHDGHTNAYHVITQSNLATRYNDISVLENHHCAMAFAILAREECSLFSDLDRSLQMSLRKTIIKLILATDMEHHFSLVTELVQHDAEFDATDDADRRLLMTAVLHAADISNPCRSFDVTAEQSKRVHMEFKKQVQDEQKRGLPSLPHMNAQTEAMQIDVELNFTDFIVAPLWCALGDLFAPHLDPLMEQMARNRTLWDERRKTLAQPEGEASPSKAAGEASPDKSGKSGKANSMPKRSSATDPSAESPKQAAAS